MTWDLEAQKRRNAQRKKIVLSAAGAKPKKKPRKPRPARKPKKPTGSRINIWVPGDIYEKLKLRPDIPKSRVCALALEKALLANPFEDKDSVRQKARGYGLAIMYRDGKTNEKRWLPKHVLAHRLGIMAQYGIAAIRSSPTFASWFMEVNWTPFSDSDAGPEAQPDTGAPVETPPVSIQMIDGPQALG